MLIQEIYLKNYRNISQLNMSFAPKINLIIGRNALGKTNLLEALYFLISGKSFRGSLERDLISENEDFAHIDGIIYQHGAETKVRMTLQKGVGKEIIVGERHIRRISDLRKKFNAITFVPDDLKIIREGRSYRRDFIDDLIFSVNPNYLKIRQDYNRILNQRNQLLKRRFQGKFFQEEIFATNESLTSVGSYIIYFRREYTKRLLNFAKISLKEISGEEIELEYINKSQEGLLEEIKEDFKKELLKVQENDLKRGFTTVGPHRDEIKIEVNGKELRRFGSQGQQRTALLALKLGHLELLKYYKEEEPVVFLDDIFSELDRQRIHYLLEQIKNYQVFITGTEAPDVDDLEIINLEDFLNR